MPDTKMSPKEAEKKKIRRKRGAEKKKVRPEQNGKAMQNIHHDKGGGGQMKKVKISIDHHVSYLSHHVNVFFSRTRSKWSHRGWCG